MEQNRRCDICNIEISKTNWSKHIKTDAVQAVNERTDRVQIKHCRICNIVVPENEWTNHLKSPSHKRSTKLIKDKLKEKVRSFNIRRQRNYGFIQRKRNFQNIDFETNDYIVKKSEKALEGCFLTIRITQSMRLVQFRFLWKNYKN